MQIILSLKLEDLYLFKIIIAKIVDLLHYQARCWDVLSQSLQQIGPFRVKRRLIGFFVRQPHGRRRCGRCWGPMTPVVGENASRGNILLRGLSAGHRLGIAVCFAQRCLAPKILRKQIKICLSCLN